jgi:hypothetical protein
MDLATSRSTAELAGPPVTGGAAQSATRGWLVLFGAALFSAALLAACGSSSGSAQASGKATAGTCQTVSAALADGPDPDADPVGYALAQVLPLRQIKTSDQTLQKAIDNLASAYQQFYDANGAGNAAKHGLHQAAAKINVLCPGAGAGS